MSPPRRDNYEMFSNGSQFPLDEQWSKDKARTASFQQLDASVCSESPPERNPETRNRRCRIDKLVALRLDLTVGVNRMVGVDKMVEVDWMVGVDMMVGVDKTVEPLIERDSRLNG